MAEEVILLFTNLCCKNKIYKNLYNGHWIESNSNKLIEIFSPVDGSLLGKVQAMTTEEVDMAIKNTKEAWQNWNSIQSCRSFRWKFWRNGNINDDGNIKR